MVQETDARSNERSDEGERPQHEVAAPVERKRKPKMIQVKVVNQRGLTALVEWMVGDDYRRAYVPLETIAEGACAEDTLQAGAPYGVAGEEYIKVQSTPQRIARELRRYGIWTLDDLQQRIATAKAAAWEACAPDFAAIIRAVRQSEGNK